MSAGWQRDVVERAREQLAPEVFAYLVQGAREGVSAAEAGWDRVRLAPHVLRDVTDVDVGADLLGTQLRRRLGRCADVPPARGPSRR